MFPGAAIETVGPGSLGAKTRCKPQCRRSLRHEHESRSTSRRSSGDVSRTRGVARKIYFSSLWEAMKKMRALPQADLRKDTPSARDALMTSISRSSSNRSSIRKSATSADERAGPRTELRLWTASWTSSSKRYAGNMKRAAEALGFESAERGDQEAH